MRWLGIYCHFSKEYDVVGQYTLYSNLMFCGSIVIQIVYRDNNHIMAKFCVQ